MDAKLISKYGNPKPVRYFVKSLEDLLDVVETVYKHISQKTESADLIELLREIECSAVPIPRTLSSHTFGFEIPRHLLETDTRPTNLSGRQLELKSGIDALPQVVHLNGRTKITKNVRSLYDILVFQRYFKSLMNQNSDGIKMFTKKRSAEISAVTLSTDSAGFQLSVSFPGIFFKGAVLPVL